MKRADEATALSDYRLWGRIRKPKQDLIDLTSRAMGKSKKLRCELFPYGIPYNRVPPKKADRLSSQERYPQNHVMTLDQIESCHS
jgi:hypothetical protein